MKVTILGTSNAWGVNEVAGTPWPLTGTLSDGTEVDFRRFRTSLLIETSDEKRILIDCGPDFSHQRREFGINRLDAILLTHPHLDYIGGLDECNVYRNAGHAVIPTYAHPACWSHIKDEKGFGYLVDVLGVLDQRELKSFESFSIGTLNVTPFGVEHSSLAPGAVGFALSEEAGGTSKRVIYTGDLWAISNPSHETFRQPTDILIMECDRWRDLAGPAVGGGHMSYEEAVRWLMTGAFSSPQPKQLVFVHFGDKGPRGMNSTYHDWRDNIVTETKRQRLPNIIPDEDMVVAYDGMVITP